MRLTSKLLKKMIREMFEKPQPPRFYYPGKKKEEKPDEDPPSAEEEEEEVKSEVRVPYKDLGAEERGMRGLSLDPSMISALKDLDPKTAKELALSLGSEEPEYPSIKAGSFEPVVKQDVNDVKYIGTLSLTPNGELEATVFIEDPEDYPEREYNGSKKFEYSKEGFAEAREWFDNKMPPFPPMPRMGMPGFPALSKESLNQIIDEEIAAMVSEADVYVPPGYEPEEDDDFDAEMAEFFANDPDALAKLKDLMGGNKEGMSLGDYLEVNPEAKEAVFGIMSGEHSDVDWESIRRSIPFGGGRLRGDVNLPELERWIAMMLKLVIKYPIDQAELYGDSERMDLEVKNLVVRGTEDQETAAMIWDEIEDLIDYYIFPILEKFRKSYKEPKDIKLIKKFETYKKALHRISQWSAVQGDMYDEFKRSYEKKFAKPPAEPVGEKLPLKEDEDN